MHNALCIKTQKAERRYDNPPPDPLMERGKRRFLLSASCFLNEMLL